MTYSDAINKINSLKSLGIMPGLSRIQNLLNKVGNPQNKIKVIHIAGTNGKGTVSKAIANALVEQNFKVGVFSSPFVDDYREQIQINNQYISEEDFAKEFEICFGKGSEFEILTAIMYHYFYESGVDYAVVECGMGGLLDSTNVVDNPELCVITSVAIDHQKFLGETLEEIAKQKAGIIKHKSNVVLYPNKCENVIKDVCKIQSANLFLVNDYKDFYINNLETAKMALAVMGIKANVTYPKLPARQERIGKILLDGAHNVDGANALQSILKNEKIVAVIGMMKDKNYDAYLKIIAPYCSKIITTTPSNPRSVGAKELSQTAKKYCTDVSFIDNPKSAVSYAKKLDYDTLLICGSFYLAQDVRKDILKDNI